MALFMPSMIVPDARSGLGLGVIDATKPMTVSWHINGPSALTAYQISIFLNDSASTQKYTTGQLTTGCPAYGTSNTGEIQFFSYTIPASALSGAGITNGNEYKLVITQWWSANDSITQTSASAFVTRATPTLSINTIGTAGVVSTRYYSFTGSYSQAQGDVLNWFRWRIAYADGEDDPFFDTQNVSGTMDISCSYDGFFTETDYIIRLTAQTENGVEIDTGWVPFSVSYITADTTGELSASCVGGTDAILVSWADIGYIPGTATGDVEIVNNDIAILQEGASVAWNQTGTTSMSLAAPWSVIWKGTLGAQNATIFTLAQSTGNITLSYNYASATITLAKGGTTLVSQSGIINTPTVTVALTPTNLYIRSEYMGGGLYPATTLYPVTTLYPAGDTIPMVDTYTLTPTYTQSAITSVTVGGYQECDFIEVIKGTPSTETITAAITNGDYTPGLNETDYLMADWSSGYNAGTLDIGGDSLQGFALYRRRGDDANLVKVAETGTKVGEVYDYGAVSQGGPYSYYLFPVGATTYISNPLVSGATTPCWWNWTLMECEETGNNNFLVLAAYRFRLNIESGGVSNNNSPALLANFTPYPKVQLSPQNYKSGTLTGLIGVVNWEDGQPRYEDTIAWRDAIYALSRTQNALFLKNRKGDLLRIRISAPVTMTTMDNSKEQAQTMTLPWAEVGSAEGVSLYSIEYVGVQSAKGAVSPDDQYIVNTADATATAGDIRSPETAYAKGKKITGSVVDGNEVKY